MQVGLITDTAGASGIDQRTLARPADRVKRRFGPADKTAKARTPPARSTQAVRAYSEYSQYRGSAHRCAARRTAALSTAVRTATAARPRLRLPALSDPSGAVAHLAKKNARWAFPSASCASCHRTSKQTRKPGGPVRARPSAQRRRTHDGALPPIARAAYASRVPAHAPRAAPTCRCRRRRSAAK